MTIHNEFVHSSGPQGRPNGIHHHLTGIDIADYLGLPLRRIGPFLQQDNGWALRQRDVNNHTQSPSTNRTSYHHLENQLWILIFHVADHVIIEPNTPLRSRHAPIS